MKSIKISKPKKMSTNGDAKALFKRPSIIIAMALVVLVVVSLVVINLTTQKISHGDVSKIENVASINTGQLFVTPATSDWWKFIADTSYSSSELSKIDPITDQEVVKLGYMNALNTDESTKSGGPLRITYIQAKTPEAAIKLKTFLESKAGETPTYNVRIDNDIVAIGPDWAFDQSLYFSEDSLGESKEYIEQTRETSRNQNVGFAYMNTKPYFAGLLDTKQDKDSKAILNEYIKYEFGLKSQDSIWSGNANSYNSLWKGKFTKGGFDEKTLDPAKATDIIQGREKVLSDDGKQAVIDPRESTLLTDVYVYSESKSPSEDKAAFDEFFKPYDNAFNTAGFSSGNSLMRGAINIAEWDSTLSDRGAKHENLSIFLFAGNADSMAFTFVRNSN